MFLWYTLPSIRILGWGHRHASGEIWPRTYYTYDKTTEIFIFLPQARYLGATRNPATFHIYVSSSSSSQPLILGKEQTKFAASSLLGNLICVSRQASTNWMYIRTLFSLLSTHLSRYLQLFQPSEDMHILLHRGPIVCRRVPTTSRLNNSTSDLLYIHNHWYRQTTSALLCNLLLLC